MKIRIFGFVMLIALLVLGLAGCERSASTAPAVAPTQTPEFPFPFATIPVANIVATSTTQTAKDVVGNSATQTAQAQVGGGAPAKSAKQDGPETATPVATTTVVATTTTVVATSVPIPLPTLERPATYQLKQGEWPICIARRYNLDLGLFFAINGLNMESRPYAGYLLRLPLETSWNPAFGDRMLPGRFTPDNYVVQPGDTIWSIACSYGPVNPEAIAVQNGLVAPYFLTPGQTLRIP
jgi:LysM repeat protein